nr:uncharacterized protein LOC122321974 [Drosophila bipectinata]
MLRSLVADARGRTPVVIGGDFNAWSPEWGSRAPNERGTSLLKHFAALDVVLANRGQKLAYSKTERESIIDITFVSSALIRRCNWEVSDAFTFSDHQAIHFTLGGTLDRSSSSSPEGAAEELSGALAHACDSAMPRRKPSRRGASVYWRNLNIQRLRTACLRACFQRARGSEELTTSTEEFKAAKRALKLSIKASKRECFRKICDKAKVDPWGTTNKWRLCSRSTRQKNETIPADDGEPFTPVTEEEIRNYAKKIKVRNTPGPDGVPNSVLRQAMQEKPEVFAKTFNKNMATNKEQGKAKKQYVVSGFRSICLLDTVRKVLEMAIVYRVSKFAEAKGTLSVSQYGFRKARSTRTLLYDTDEGPKSYEVTAGGPQGSVLGPRL